MFMHRPPSTRAGHLRAGFVVGAVAHDPHERLAGEPDRLERDAVADRRPRRHDHGRDRLGAGDQPGRLGRVHRRAAADRDDGVTAGRLERLGGSLDQGDRGLARRLLERRRARHRRQGVRHARHEPGQALVDHDQGRRRPLLGQDRRQVGGHALAEADLHRQVVAERCDGAHTSSSGSTSSPTRTCPGCSTSA
jgi:hypothetical protein